MPGTDRRNSSSSEDASLPPTKQILQDGTEFIPTRTAKSGAPKPAANPLQFIKVGPCDLYKAAQEQLKKVEEIKKVEKTVKTEAEDWQSNLDNWKCSRRKRQEHIIDRVVEVKKFELEEQERNRRRGKTLNEMMEERAQKGIGPRKMSLMTYPDDDTDDFTDLGLSLSNKGNDSSEADSHNETEQNDNLKESENKVENGKKNGSNGHDPSSSEAEEYTYERAIQGYKSYAEKSAKAASRPRVSPPKPGGRIGEKLNELEQVRLRSNSVSDVQLPKVDIHKRRSLFEVVESAETKSPSAERVARDLGGAQIVKERLSSLERRSDSPKSSPRPTEEISITLKDRLSNLEKQKSQEPVNRLPSDEIAHVSIKERLTSLEKGIKENISSNSCSDEEMKELLSPAASEREISSPLVSDTTNSKMVTVIDELVAVGKHADEKLDAISVVSENSIVVVIDQEVKESAEENSAKIIVSETEKDESGKEEKLMSDKEEAEESTMVEQTIVVTSGEGPITITSTSSSENSEPTKETDEVPNSIGTNKTMIIQEKKKGGNLSPLKVTVSHKMVKKPPIRRRKLTPILTAPIVPLSPVKNPGDLQIISEDSVVISRDTSLQNISEDGEIVPMPARRQTAKGAETSESGIDMEESSLYTDENIDEVLGADDDEDVDEYPESREDDNIMEPHDEDLEELNHPRPISLERHRDDSGFSENRAEDEMKIEAERKEKESELRRQQEAVTRFDELIGFGKEEPANIVKAEVPVESVEISMKKPVEEVSIVDNFVVDEVRKPVEEILTPVTLPMKQKETPIALYENISIVNQMMELASPSDVIGFPLSPTSGVEPPKEKPPPPPIDLSDDEPAPELPPKSTSLRRLDSTKRIKKEIRKKRSDFLGIEGANDDAYLEPEVDVEPPPDMITLLQEERRLEQQLYRQSLSSDADSTENASTVDRLEKTLFSDQGLYRQSICSESDSNHETAESRDSGVELDRGHVDELCWNKPSSEPHSRQNSEPYGNPSVTSEEDEISKKEREIIAALEKEEEWRYGKPLTTANDAAIGDVLAVKLRQLEEEKLQLEWERAEEEGRRMADEERIQAKETLLRQQETSPNTKQSASKSQDNLRAERERLEKEQLELERARQELMRQRSSEPPVRQAPMGSNLRYSMPDLQETRPPPPNPRPPATWSRAPSADNLLAPQQMTRTTLHALSAAPRSRIVNGETWMQPKRKSDAPKSSYNYQHWLIQEAEHRRITEQQQRATQARRSLPVQASRSPAHYTQPAPPQQRPISAHYPVGHTHAANGPLIASPPIPNGVNYGSSPIGSHVRALSNPGHPPSVQHSHNLSAPNPHTVGLPPSPHPHNGKPLPDSIIQTLTQRVQNKAQSPRRRVEERPFPTKVASPESPHLNGEQERMLSVSGKKKCSHCGDELGRGAAMVIESLRLFYHIDCFKCCVCHTQLGDGLMGTDVRVRNNKLHCHNCYSSDDGFSTVEARHALPQSENESFLSNLSLDLEDEEPFQIYPKASCCRCCSTSTTTAIMFLKYYQANEDRRYIENRRFNIELIDTEIRKCQILKDAVDKLFERLEL